MRLTLILPCVLAALVVSGCAKKSSKEFHKLSADQELLVLRDGDDAWVSAEMSTILGGLEAVPENTIEKPRAAALVEKIKAERARVEQERAEAAKPRPAPEDPFAGRLPSASGAVVEPAPAAADQGATDGGAPQAPRPFLGMSEALFTQLFGACVSPGPTVKLSSGADAATVLELTKSPECRKKLGVEQAEGSTVFLFGPKGLAEQVTTTIGIIDGGQIITPGRQPPTPDPGPPQLTIPGAPVPEGIDAGGVVPMP